MKKLMIICTAVIFSATVSAQNTSSTGTNTSTVSVYKSPDILTDKAVAEAKKVSLSNHVAPAQTNLPPPHVQQAPVINGQTKPVIDPTKTVAVTTETLPAILKGSSMDPDARPVLADAKTQDVVVPAQNSGNTKPAADQKQVTKENNSVPSSTIPVKKD